MSGGHLNSIGTLNSSLQKFPGTFIFFSACRARRIFFCELGLPNAKSREFQCFGMGILSLAHRNRSDFCDLRLRCPSRRPEIARFPRQEKAMLHCDLRLRWKVASDLRFRAAISEPKTPSFCGISGDLAPSTRRSLAIAIVRFWCAKILRVVGSSV